MLQVQLVASWAHEVGRLNHHWMRLCSVDFGLLPSPPGVAADEPGAPPSAWWSTEAAQVGRALNAQQCYRQLYDRSGINLSFPWV